MKKKKMRAKRMKKINQVVMNLKMMKKNLIK
jgi:hypothetical protein